ncbi:MAG: LamG domain-containing protein, partial [Desulfitobacteriaceae bacterium]|nr:LamG domain-containing protein [Desulfitobacteriaceae bacterium]
FCFCLNLLFPAITLAEPDSDFIGGDNYSGLIDDIRIYNKVVALPAPEPELTEPDYVDGYIGGDNYFGTIDEVIIYDQPYTFQAEPEPAPEPEPKEAAAFIGGDNYHGSLDDLKIYEAAVPLINNAPTITFRGLTEGQEISDAENSLNFGLVIDDADVDFDTELKTELYIGFLDAYQKVTTFTINNSTNSKGEFTAQNGTEYDITINKGAYVPKYVTEFKIKVIATDKLDLQGEKILTLINSTNILAHWALDSVRDGIAVDSGGLGNNGVIQGATPTTGIINNAIALDGVDNSVEVPLTPSLTLTTGSFSIEAWVKTGDAPTVDKGVVGNYQTTTTPYWLLKQYGETEAERGKFGFSLRDDQETAVHITSTKPLNDNEWHHLVGVRDATKKKVAFYVDGDIVQELAAALGNVNSEQNICFATHLTRYFQGCLDEVILYGCALSADEVKRNYQRGVLLKNIKMTNHHNDESTAYCTFGVHKNNLEFDLVRTVGKLGLELDLPSSIKVEKIEKVFKDGVLIPNPAENPVVTFTDDAQIIFTQTLEAGHYQVELLLNIDEHLIIKAKAFSDERRIKINYVKELFWFKFMDSDALPNVL